jgi:hypothetical protein
MAADAARNSSSARVCFLKRAGGTFVLVSKRPEKSLPSPPLEIGDSKAAGPHATRSVEIPAGDLAGLRCLLREPHRTSRWTL